MATGNSAHGQPAAFERAMLGQGFYRILGTGRREAATRPEHRADSVLVNPDKKDQEARHRLHFSNSRSNSSRMA